MPTGRIKYYNPEKGFGFIAQDSGDADVFLHNSSVKYWEDDELRIGQRVQYSVVEGKRGLVAQDVEVLLSPIERKWLRQGKAVIPRDYLGSLSQHPEKGFNLDQSFEAGNVEQAGAAGSQSEPLKDVEHRINDVTKKHANGSTAPKPRSKRVSRPTFGNLYIQKQIEFQTDMVFGLYDHQFMSGTIRGFNKHEFILRIDDDNIEVSRTKLKFCHKVQDTDKLQEILRYDESVRDQKLGPVGASEDGFQIDTRQLIDARENRVPIEVTMREGEIFLGNVDWESPNEIKLVLRNGSKIVLFRSAVKDFRVCSKEEM
ncbi:MAG: cold-shock protein [Candidatus Poribacteria bacterium]|nr:cold-shock protein [Candidatus Poribacteria bacterium]MDE0503314.1 cold-shock protein [Candidatus Poribacteria bacterium]